MNAQTKRRSATATSSRSAATGSASCSEGTPGRGDMATTPQVSIGAVLDQLRPEFDDITISKIRFLESQGLIDPERTPSGYRKFSPSDVDRLRFILRQQREHFLPLKVIKVRCDQLDQGVPAETFDAPADAPPAAAQRPRRRKTLEAEPLFE